MSKISSNKLATMPIGKLLFSMSVPAIISMIIQSLYNIVDSIYVAQLGQDALFAMGLVFPMQMIGLSVALGCGIGTNALVARRLGQKRLDHASQTATTGIVLSVIHSVVLLVFGLLFAKPFLSLFSDNPEIISMGSTYLYIVMGFSIGQQVQISCEKILQATGNMLVPMTALFISAGLNIILDPIMIFGYLGFPAMGVAGAALATVIGQLVGMVYIVFVLFKKSHDVKIELKGFRFNAIVVKKIYKIGIPTMIMNAIGSVTTTAMNSILVGFSSVAVNVLNIYFKMQSFVFMPVFGLLQGGMPILSYNYGAKNKERYVKTMKYTFITTVVILWSGTVLFLLAPTPILNLFNPTEELITIGVPALRIICLSFIFASISIPISTMFQSLGLGVKSMLLSVFRQLILLVPIAYALALLVGLDGVWWAYVVADILVVLIFVPVAYKTIKKAFQ